MQFGRHAEYEDNVDNVSRKSKPRKLSLVETKRKNCCIFCQDQIISEQRFTILPEIFNPHRQYTEGGRGWRGWRGRIAGRGRRVRQGEGDEAGGYLLAIIQIMICIKVDCMQINTAK